MQETRKQVKERLQAADRWQDFTRRRAELVAEGLSPSEARKQALQEVDAQPPATAPVNGAQTVGQRGEAFSGENATEEAPVTWDGRIPNREAVQWVAENIGNKAVRPENAPSGLAWGLLSWVRQHATNQNTFWTSIWAKLLPPRAELTAQEEHKRDEGSEKVLGLIDSILGEIDEQMKREMKENDDRLRAEVRAELRAELEPQVRADLEGGMRRQ